MKGGGQKVGRDTGKGGRITPTEKRVTGPCEMNFINEIFLSKRADEFTATFAMHMPDVVFTGELVQKTAQTAVMPGNGCGNHGVDMRRSEQVDLTPFPGKDRVVRIEAAMSRNDAAEWLASGTGDGHCHLIGIQCSSADEKGIGSFPKHEEALEIRL